MKFIKKLKKYGEHHRVILFVLIFTLIGVSLLALTRAANFSSEFEAESGTLSGNATVVSDTSASEGKAVKFSAGTNSWPGPNDHKVCGNTSILNGPTSAPAGAVTVNPGTDLNTLTNNSSAGTTFYLKAGTHTLPSGPINPKTGNSYIGAPGAILDGQFRTNYTSGSRVMSMAFKGSGSYSNVTIKYLTIKNFGQSDGKMVSMVNQTAINWGQSPGWTISNNTITKNGGSGLWAVSGAKVTYNCIDSNEQLGWSVPSKGSTDFTQHTNILVENNEISNNNPTNAIETVGVCSGCAGGLKVWNSKNVTIRNNNVHNNNGSGIWIDNNNIDVLIDHNVSKDNLDRGIFYEISYSGKITNNYVTGNYVAQSSSSGNNNTGIYISESGGDETVKTYLGGTFPAELDVSNNYVVDNLNGISLWENANRYCAEDNFVHNDTSWCPPTIQGHNSTELAAGRNRCITDLANNADVCRWRTRNVKVHNNKFERTSASTWCSSSSCFRVAIWASTNAPSGTPYAGTAIQTAISKNNNNLFSNNTYIGSWNFSIPGSSVVTRDAWQNTWNQDAGSTFN